MSAALAALFDMVKHHAPLVDFNQGGGPGFDLYATRGRRHQAKAMEVLVAAGLAHSFELSGVVYHRLDEEARAALGG